MPAPGDRYDRFEVEEVLGQGGMATVYRVRHLTLGSRHALKVLDLPLPSVRARLVQEGQVQARLRHPNIVAVTDLIEVDGAPGLVMEYVGGPTLDAWLQRNRADARTAETVFAGILDAVSFAHREGLVHRDLKPGNVLLSTVDGRVVPKVTDFGLAKLLSGSGTDHQTRTGFAMGTPGYMAPEQVRNAKDVDARTDVFALGCILYELWCGIPAFGGKDVFRTLEAMEARRYTDPRAQRPDLPDRVFRAITGALAPDRADRLASCEALRAVLADRPAPAPVPPEAQAAWAGGEGLQTAVSAFPARVPTPAPPAPRPAPATFDPRLPPASLFEGTSRATTMGAAAGAGALLVAGVATLVVCAGVAWFAPIWGSPPPPAEAPVVDASAGEAPGVPPPPAAEPGAASPPVGSPVRPATDPSAASATRAPTADPLSRGSSPTPSSIGASGGERASAPTTALPSPAPPAPLPAATPVPAEPVAPPPAAAVGHFAVKGTVDSVWLESGGRRFGPGNVPPGTYTLHARWGPAEVERRVTVVAGQTLTATCDPSFVNCAVH